MQRLRGYQRWIGEKKRFLAQASAECREAFEKIPSVLWGSIPSIAVSCLKPRVSG